jgi:hypothetical protein
MNLILKFMRWPVSLWQSKCHLASTYPGANLTAACKRGPGPGLLSSATSLVTPPLTSIPPAMPASIATPSFTGGGGGGQEATATVTAPVAAVDVGMMVSAIMMTVIVTMWQMIFLLDAG